MGHESARLPPLEELSPPHQAATPRGKPLRQRPDRRRSLQRPHPANVQHQPMLIVTSNRPLKPQQLGDSLKYLRSGQFLIFRAQSGSLCLCLTLF
jgi:hypothetical protein